MSNINTDIKPLDWIDNKVKTVTKQIMEFGKDANWPKVQEGLKEIAFLCGKRGLTRNQALVIRKDIIQAIEVFEPLAKTHIDQLERIIQ